MAGRADTKALGLHGLFVKRIAVVIAPAPMPLPRKRREKILRWIGPGRAVLEFRCLTGDWAGALALLDAKSTRSTKTAIAGSAP